MAVDGRLNHFFRFNGTSWGKAVGVGPAALVSGQTISCASATGCWIADEAGRVDHWNGSGWTATRLRSSYGAWPAIDCATSSACMLVDSTGGYDWYNGSSWSAPHEFDRTSGSILDISCDGATSCFGTDYHGKVVHWDGSAWGPPAYLSPNGSYVDCPEAGWCMTVDSQNGTWRAYAGAWGATHQLSTLLPRDGLACADRSMCVAFEGGDVRHFDGASWSATRHVFPSTAGPRVTAQCPTRSTCIAIDQDHHLWSRWDGRSWSTPKPSGIVGGWDERTLSCPTASFCMALGDRQFATFNGSTWSTVRHGMAPLLSASCLSGHLCVGLSAPDQVWMWDGVDWAPTTTSVAVPGDFVSCSTPTSCLAYGAGKSAWTVPPT
jgi:hypothetical protein